MLPSKKKKKDHKKLERQMTARKLFGRRIEVRTILMLF